MLRAVGHSANVDGLFLGENQVCHADAVATQTVLRQPLGGRHEHSQIHETDRVVAFQ
jgi:hypothetical protein